MAPRSVLRYWARNGKSNLCPPPLRWRDFETAEYFKELRRRTRSTRVMLDELRRLQVANMQCEIKQKTYYELFCHARDKPETIVRLWDMMEAAGVPPSVAHYRILLYVHGRRRDLPAVVKVMAELRASGLRPDPTFYQHAMMAFARCGKAALAENVFAAAVKDGVPLDSRMYETAVSTAATPAAAATLLARMRADGIEPSRAHLLHAITPCVRALDSPAAEALVEQIGLCAVSATRLLGVYEKTADERKLAALVEKLLQRRDGLRLDWMCFHAAAKACAVFAAQRRDEWVLRAEACFDAFVELEVRHQSGWEPIVATLAALYVRLLDAEALEYFRKKLQNEGFRDWTPMLLEKLAHIKLQVKAAPSRLPENRTRLSYSEGVLVPTRYANALPYW
eukprot:TRINITY_DN13151_c0_g1_i1.p1 TRINITY_DN13151_c0_g1~~TRINITY_DN13151_c0_g1_i1.p1  ORF type:complete len:394 (+),score=110.63 TRINITY_DN13151_c0_g1_i1:156-1337(+)